MGNYRFKLSDMIPNAWFYKLKDMGRGKKQNTTSSKQKKKPSSPLASTQSSKPKQQQQQPYHHHQCSNNNNNPRKSYYFTRDLNPSNKLHTSPKLPHPNYSPDPPRKSSSKKTRPKRRTTKRISFSPSPKNQVASTVSAGCSCRTTLESMWTKSDSPPEPSYSSYSSSPFCSSPDTESPVPGFRTDHVLPIESSFDEMVSLSTITSCHSCKLSNTTTKDIIIDVDKNSIETRKDDKLDRYCNYHEYDDTFSELELPPIITKPPKFINPGKKTELKQKPRSRIVTREKGSLKVRILKEGKEDTASLKEQQQQQRNGSVKRLSANSPGVKLRVHSPKIACRKVQSHGRKSVSSTASSGSRRSLSDSFAIVKSSLNPMKDFRESMVEMIVENNIRTSKDLEDLLACYLSLNSDEYHDLIIKVFKQIWFDLTAPRYE